MYLLVNDSPDDEPDATVNDSNEPSTSSQSNSNVRFPSS